MREYLPYLLIAGAIGIVAWAMWPRPEPPTGPDLPPGQYIDDLGRVVDERGYPIGPAPTTNTEWMRS